ncbi:protein stum homolog isoform X2 [Babylonia areolata]|uniref:protein stum homolog isoform X2 n=1 Tax=Babylonia areolata TaxID=304850 RepID=UPI003FD660EC
MTGKDGDAEAQTSLTTAAATSPDHQEHTSSSPRRTSGGEHAHHHHHHHAPRRASGGKHLHGGGGLSREEGAQILEVTEKHGALYNSIPCMPLPVAILCCIFNIVVPGLGTFISAWTSLCGCKTRLGHPAKAFGLNLLAAFLQMVTFVLIVGWVWSIIWGMNFVQIATVSKNNKGDKRSPAEQLRD